jgi:hypothetical protein
LRPILIIRKAISLMLVSSLLLTACDIEFTPDVEPLILEDAPGQSFAEDPTSAHPEVSPIPIAPTALPYQPGFKGADDLDCQEPMVDDAVYGYCKIPGTQQYYIWTTCVESCPESPYRGTLVKRVDDSLLVQEFVLLINGRDAAKSSRDDFRIAGVGLGLGELIVGGLTFAGACIVGSAFSFGTTCAAWFGTAILAGGGAWYSGSRAAEEGDTMNSKEEAARDRFDEIPESTPSPPSDTP